MPVQVHGLHGAWNQPIWSVTIERRAVSVGILLVAGK